MRQPRHLFHTQDLAVIWGLTGNTLYQTITRYTRRGLLIRIHKGFYSTLPLDDLDPVELGIGYLHRYAYLSTESILTRQGIINQTIPYLTLVSSVSRRFRLGSTDYVSRRLQDQFLHQTAGITTNGYPQATVERAVADLWYFNPRYHVDNRQLVDWEKVSYLQKEIGFR